MADLDSASTSSEEPMINLHVFFISVLELAVSLVMILAFALLIVVLREAIKGLKDGSE